ncbi:LysR family transcriptional regulator [Allokutzneria sp. NRRL B-24872]|uniref:LysR family transcriptional regulator n=1 Tax=Allokutzneria sp. NRRL B-24872 TaxID=1137961 RepID=UPI000A3D5736|nr:LysR family transcriptional regulator [Allokutzneria sp. NRRL B-24872]
MTRPELALHQLHAFVVLAELRHFGRAAQRLGIAQPPLSQQIRRLEERVGFPLFTRAPGRVELTPAGAELLPAARRALDAAEDGLTAARRAGAGEAGRLRIGFAASLALTILPGIVRAYRERFPLVQTEIHEMTTTPQIAALRERAIDVGFIREIAEVAEVVAEPGLACEPLLSEGFVVVLPTGHPLADLRAVPISALAEEELVLLPREAGAGVHDRIVNLFRDNGVEPKIGQRAVEWQTACAFVAAGMGVTVAPECVRRMRLSGVVHRKLDPDTARTVVAVCWRAGEENPLLDQFLTLAVTTK